MEPIQDLQIDKIIEDVREDVGVETIDYIVSYVKGMDIMHLNATNALTFTRRGIMKILKHSVITTDLILLLLHIQHERNLIHPHHDISHTSHRIQIQQLPLRPIKI